LKRSSISELEISPGTKKDQPEELQSKTESRRLKPEIQPEEVETLVAQGIGRVETPNFESSIPKAAPRRQSEALVEHHRCAHRQDHISPRRSQGYNSHDHHGIPIETKDEGITEVIVDHTGHHPAAVPHSQLKF
jgi:hypothetical protein